MNSIGSMYNASFRPSKQVEIEQWAKTFHPKKWAELEFVGVDQTNLGRRFFRIDRRVDH